MPCLIIVVNSEVQTFVKLDSNSTVLIITFVNSNKPLNLIPRLRLVAYKLGVNTGTMSFPNLKLFFAKLTV